MVVEGRLTAQEEREHKLGVLWDTPETAFNKGVKSKASEKYWRAKHYEECAKIAEKNGGIEVFEDADYGRNSAAERIALEIREKANE